MKFMTTFPSTRFQGSKLKLSDWIWSHLKNIPFDTALDAFGGTGSVAYKLKQADKQVTYNDSLTFNWYIGLALIENSSKTLSAEQIEQILTPDSTMNYPSFIAETFQDIYFTEAENLWLDQTVTNIQQIDEHYIQAIAYFALFQSCIAKRPFNLFHRKNLYLRLNKVNRNFGNKTTWDTPFENHFRKYVREANQAVFNNHKTNRAINKDVFHISGNYDLVYLDPPYISNRGTGVDYFNFYHFLEGLVNYHDWLHNIDYQSKHRRLKVRKTPWTNPKEIASSFDSLFQKFQQSTIALSYRSDGIPSITELKSLLKKYKPCIQEYRYSDYRYVLSKKQTDEVLLIGI